MVRLPLVPSAYAVFPFWPTVRRCASVPSRKPGRKSMPNVSAEKLIEIAKALLVSAGASEEEATVIARYNTGANLVGHDCHGIILIPQYIERIKVGHIV